MVFSSPHPAPEVPLYHFDRLGRLGQNPAVVREIKALFVQLVPGQVRELKLAVEAGEWLAAEQGAHSLKSMFGNLGMDEIVAQLRQVEDLARQGTDQRQQQLIVQAIDHTATVVAQCFTQDLQPAH
ncbi:Hpt domain-containing protein [Hymenobacter rigui]|nr:Hpt domain-containing protein [Hymenobacter rigui]